MGCVGSHIDSAVCPRRSTPTGDLRIELAISRGDGLQKFDRPFLILHGQADKIISPSGSEDFYKRAASADKTIKRYEGFRHEILNEPEQAVVRADIRDWLEKHLTT